MRLFACASNFCPARAHCLGYCVVVVVVVDEYFAGYFVLNAIVLIRVLKFSSSVCGSEDGDNEDRIRLDQS